MRRIDVRESDLSVDEVRTGVRRYFTTLEDLTRYLSSPSGMDESVEYEPLEGEPTPLTISVWSR